MAKKQSFGDKVLKQKAESKRLAKIVVAERKENGHIRFRSKMVEIANLKEELKAAQQG